MLYDNSGAKPVLIAKRLNGRHMVMDEKLFEKIKREAV